MNGIRLESSCGRRLAVIDTVWTAPGARTRKYRHIVRYCVAEAHPADGSAPGDRRWLPAEPKATTSHRSLEAAERRARDRIEQGGMQDCERPGQIRQGARASGKAGSRSLRLRRRQHGGAPLPSGRRRHGRIFHRQVHGAAGGFPAHRGVATGLAKI